MTVASTLNKNIYEGNGTTTSWPITFPFTDTSEIQVYITDTYGVTTQLTKDYLIDIANSQVIYPGYVGNKPTDAPPTLPSGWKITIRRSMSLTQEIALSNQGAWNPDVVENEFDKLTMITQQIQEQVDRCVKLDISDNEDPSVLLQNINASLASAANYATISTNASTEAIFQANIATQKATESFNSASAAANSAVQAATIAANVGNVVSLPTTDVGGNIWISEDLVGIEAPISPKEFATLEAPENPQYHQLWFDAVTKTAKIYDNASWDYFNIGLYMGNDLAPQNPITNQTWFDTNRKKALFYNGTSWVPFTQNIYFSATSTARQTIYSTIPVAIDGLSISLTPVSANSRFLIMAVVNGTLSHVSSSLICRNGTQLITSGNNLNNSAAGKVGTQATTYYGNNIPSNMLQHHLIWVDAPNTTSQITYDIRHMSAWSGTAYTTYVNSRDSNDMCSPSSLVIIEF